MNIKYPKSMMWFVGLFSVAISLGIFHGAAYGFLFFGCSVILSLTFAYVKEVL